jgi:hypothetical protein
MDGNFDGMTHFTSFSEDDAVDEILEVCGKYGVTAFGLMRIAASMHAMYAREIVTRDKQYVLIHAQDIAGLADFLEANEANVE